MSAEPQTYANHHRYDPWYHYVGFALVLLSLGLSLVHLVRTHGGLWQVIISLALLVAFLRLRIYALRVQDRLIRLEETLRMQAILPEPLRGRIHELRTGQIVALRFAADGELAARVAEALTENLGSGAIKQRIQTWRPDTFRV